MKFLAAALLFFMAFTGCNNQAVTGENADSLRRVIDSIEKRKDSLQRLVDSAMDAQRDSLRQRERELKRAFDSAAEARKDSVKRLSNQ